MKTYKIFLKKKPFFGYFQVNILEIIFPSPFFFGLFLSCESSLSNNIKLYGSVYEPRLATLLIDWLLTKSCVLCTSCVTHIHFVYFCGQPAKHLRQHFKHFVSSLRNRKNMKYVFDPFKKRKITFSSI